MLYSKIEDHLKPQKDTINNHLSFVFNPKFNYGKRNNYPKYLKSANSKNNKRLDNYSIIFEVDRIGNILSKHTEIEYIGGKTEKIKNDKVDNYILFVNKKLIDEQRSIEGAKIIENRQKKDYNERAKKFEKECLNPWNGSHIKFTRLVKEQLHDPSSFEHVTTNYRLYNEFAIVNT